MAPDPIFSPENRSGAPTGAINCAPTSDSVRAPLVTTSDQLMSGIFEGDRERFGWKGGFETRPYENFVIFESLRLRSGHAFVVITHPH